MNFYNQFIVAVGVLLVTSACWAQNKPEASTQNPQDKLKKPATRVDAPQKPVLDYTKPRALVKRGRIHRRRRVVVITERDMTAPAKPVSPQLRRALANREQVGHVIDNRFFEIQ